jgi:3',5'-nucleoside bisphosphate phosphatase
LIVDLHTHTDQSDGTMSPSELVDHALELGLAGLAITDHDNLDAYKIAKAHLETLDRPHFDLLCGIELSTKAEFSGRQRSVHLLGYWPTGKPSVSFLNWLAELRTDREDRNHRLAERLRALGFDVQVEEARSIGRYMTGRPHFAIVMRNKGYVASIEEAFKKYLGEEGAAYVDRHEPTLAESIGRVRESGGVASIAHPARLPIGNDFVAIERFLEKQVDVGLDALEVQHSDHSAEFAYAMSQLAERFRLLPTGGSDFHGENKPSVKLGRGRGNVHVPEKYLAGLRSKTAR